MLASCCVARKIFLSPASASSSARTLDSHPTTNGVIMCGKMTTSRMGIIGSRRVSDFSFDVSMRKEVRSQKSESRDSSGLFKQCHVDLLRHHHFLGDQELADLLIRRQVIHQVQHQ